MDTRPRRKRWPAPIIIPPEDSNYSANINVEVYKDYYNENPEENPDSVDYGHIEQFGTCCQRMNLCFKRKLKKIFEWCNCL